VSRGVLSVRSVATLGLIFLLAVPIFPVTAQPTTFDGPHELFGPNGSLRLPRLLTVLPQVAGTALHAAGQTRSSERVQLHPEVLGFSAFTLNVQGEEFRAELVESERRAASEMFRYRVEGEELLSTFTKSYDGIVFGQIQAGGKRYFISSEENDHLLVSSSPVLFPEIIRYPFANESEPVALALGLPRRRAVRSGSLPAQVPVVIAICLDYRDAVGGAENAIARATHMIDRQNSAYRASGFSGRVELREIAFIDPPPEVVPRGLYAWSINPAGLVAQIRKRNKAAATIVLSQGALQIEALRTSPAPINPDYEVAIVAGFFAEWDDGDISNFLHEVGHLSGGDHNPESSRHPPDDPQASARDWYSCEESIYGALSYNVCDKWLQTIEMYSGLHAVYAGKVRGSEMQNNVGMFEKVFEFMKGDHD
jgi:hypothetical protein